MASLNTQQAIAIPSPEYPIRTQQTAGFVGGVPTDILALSFTDKILITITQGGRLAQWVR
jgi:proteasome assembly chaperone 3